MSDTFGARLNAALDARGSLCVGIDPHPGLLEAWKLPGSVDGLARFADTCVSAFADSVAVIKPQSAFFEAYGAAGIAVLERTITACRSAGALVLLDVKRGDVGSTMSAYAQAYLHPASSLAADAITVSPYLGIGALNPAFVAAQEHGGGVFVVALTSNPEGPQFQHARVGDSRIVGQVVAEAMTERNAGAVPLGSFGLVVGATIADIGVSFDRLNGPILAPGVGAQGGTADDVRRIFGDALPAVLPSLSRSVLRFGPDITALREAVTRQADEFAFLRR